LPFGLQAIPVAATEASQIDSDRELLVLFVRPNSAAALAGIREGDRVETINQQPPLLADGNFGLTTNAAEISLGLRRDKQQLTLKLVRSPVNK
jgi:membrane-associated protease RseP (regulator of RpoE activity)